MKFWLTLWVFSSFFIRILLFSWVLKRYEKYEFVLSQHFSLIFRFYWLFFWVFVLNFVSFVHNFANFSSFFIRILLFSWVLKRYEKYELLLSQHFFLIFRFIETIFVSIYIIFVSIYVIFVSFSILFHGNSAFFVNLREVRKVRARTVPEPPYIHYWYRKVEANSDRQSSRVAMF
jgi:hypothetical protein